MRLLKLSADKSSFRTVQFNKSGVSFILGKQKDKSSSGNRKTYNGVGKSLLIVLIHFCLGANKNKSLEKAIPNWTFTLEFENKGEVFVVSRSTSKQNEITINNSSMNVAAFNELLGESVFGIDSTIEYLKFRPLISRFIRPSRESYASFESIYNQEKPYGSLICLVYLLGLDVSLAVEKYRLKAERDRIRSFRENLSQDSVFKEFFTGDRDVRIDLKDLEEKIATISEGLKSFQVAENYYNLQKEADQTKRALQDLKNEATLLTNALESIERSLQVRSDISTNKVVELYEEAKIHLGESVRKELFEVEAFHSSLVSNRVKRLSTERSQLEQQLKSINKVIAATSNSLNSQLSFLKSHGALEEFVELSEHLSDLKAKSQKIRDYQNLLDKYSNETQEINIKMSEETRKANTYLKQEHQLLDKNMEVFRSFSRRFYPDKPGGLSVKNNEGENQIRFDIEAHIQDDAADGINEVKIFCFDMTLLKLHHNHNVSFVCHDSRLFSDIDPRQRAELFRIAYDETINSGYQYIATINEDQINSLKNYLSEDEFKKHLTDNIVLELTDDSPSSKLLGVQVDMQYE